MNEKGFTGERKEMSLEEMRERIKEFELLFKSLAEELEILNKGLVKIQSSDIEETEAAKHLEKLNMKIEELKDFQSLIKAWRAELELKLLEQLPDDGPSS